MLVLGRGAPNFVRKPRVPKTIHSTSERIEVTWVRKGTLVLKRQDLKPVQGLR